MVHFLLGAAQSHEFVVDECADVVALHVPDDAVVEAVVVAVAAVIAPDVDAEAIVVAGVVAALVAADAAAQLDNLVAAYAADPEAGTTVGAVAVDDDDCSHPPQEHGHHNFQHTNQVCKKGAKS